MDYYIEISLTSGYLTYVNMDSYVVLNASSYTTNLLEPFRYFS